MKGFITVCLILLLQKGFAQTIVYTFNNGQFLSEEEINPYLESAQKSLPPSFVLTPTIYHKAAKKDTIINYVSFSLNKEKAGQQTPAFKFSYKQDSTFLLLDKKLPSFRLKIIETLISE